MGWIGGGLGDIWRGSVTIVSVRVPVAQVILVVFCGLAGFHPAAAVLVELLEQSFEADQIDVDLSGW